MRKGFCRFVIYFRFHLWKSIQMRPWQISVSFLMTCELGKSLTLFYETSYYVSLSNFLIFNANVKHLIVPEHKNLSIPTESSYITDLLPVAIFPRYSFIFILMFYFLPLLFFFFFFLGGVAFFSLQSPDAQGK